MNWFELVMEFEKDKKFKKFFNEFDKSFKDISIDTSIHTANTGSKYYFINQKEYRIADHSKKNKFGDIEFYDEIKFFDQISDLIDNLEYDNINTNKLREIYNRYIKEFDMKKEKREQSIKKAKETRLNNEYEQIEQFKKDIQQPNFINKMIDGRFYSKTNNKVLISRKSYIWDFIKQFYPKITKFHFESTILSILKNNFST